MEEFDTIIIGSGAGGLSTALCLAKSGQKVLVLEQHDVPGGWCHSFYLQGQRFSPGVHYIGLLAKEESTSMLYEGLGIANDLVFFRMNKAGYEHCWIGDEHIDLPAGLIDLENSLGKRFPLEINGINRYLETVRKVSRQLQLIPIMNGLWDNLLIPFRTRHLGKFGLFSLKRVLDWHIKDPLLKNVLNIQCGDYGLPPSRASFPLHCAVMDHYFDGGYYPMGGGAAIVKAMTNAIKKHGGIIRTGQSVKKIIIEGQSHKKATGVLLADGRQIKAKRIVSNADPGKTYLELVGEAVLTSKQKTKLKKTRYSITSLILFLTIDMDVKRAGIDSGNIWKIKNKDADTDSLFNELMAKDILTAEEFPAMFISCTSLKDPVSFNGRYHNFEVVTFINYEAFREFEGIGYDRNEKYLKAKERICQKFMITMEKVIPGIKSHIVQMELGTPITNAYYINSTNGSVYGTEKSFDQTGPFAYSNKATIENLFLCGASILSHGVAGASQSGVKTAATILNCNPKELLKNREGQHVRIFDAEDSTDWPSWMLKKIEDKKRCFKEAKPLTQVSI